jgi:chemotaxis protein methyltransferase CheR
MELDATTFHAFCDLVYDRSGIRMSEGKAPLVSSRLSKRVQQLELSSYREYLRYLEKDASGQEMVLMLDAISTNVTSFFREADHFELIRKVIPKWVEKNQRRFRFWSAASSTGEEPYTLAMVLNECFASAGSVDWRILASDIQGIPANLLAEYFEKTGRQDDAVYTVRESLRKRVAFHRINLSKPPFPMQGPLDIIMCRNVMIYFDNVVRTRLLKEFYRLLKPGGILLVGHSESLTGLLSDFTPIGPSVYRKERP